MEKRKVVGMDYHCIRMIGEGAFSRVFLAEGRDGQRYACKTGSHVEILRREAQILGGLCHPLFPAYIDFEECGGEGRLIMEYISGKNLGQAARSRGGFSARQTMKIAEELTDGLRYLHERQPAILYRDLKPENIMLCENGHLKLIDFGCACHLDRQGGEKAGTPGFAPPEQLESGLNAGLYSDVYSLGKTLESLMHGERACGSGGGRRGRKGEKSREKGKPAGAGKRGAEERRRSDEERRCRRRLERLIGESVRVDPGRRPQDMISVSHLLTGKRAEGNGVICEKNIWESGYKNACSLESI